MNFICKKILLPFALLIWTCIAVMPSYAGHWSVSFENSGSANIIYADDQYQGPNGQTATYPWPTTSQDGFSYSVNNRNLWTTTQSGTVTPVLTWVPDSSSDTAPVTVCVQETAYALGETDEYNGGTGADTSANDGLGDTPTDVNNPDWGGWIGECSTGSHTISKDNPSGSTVVRLDAVTLSATGGSGLEIASTAVSLSISVTGPKSILINGPGNVFTSGQWNGMGDTLFSNNNLITGPRNPSPSFGTDYGPVNFSASLIGGPWPANVDFESELFSRSWDWAADGGVSASGSTFDINSVSTARSHVYWPWDSDGIEVPRDPLEFCSNAPSPQQQHVLLRLTDVDNSGSHPEWNFANTANYYVTFHSEGESPSDIVSVPTPLSDNPWEEYKTPDGGTLSQVGIDPSTDSSGQPIQGTGTYPWSPGSVSVYVEYNCGFSLDIPFGDISFGLNGGVNYGTQATQNVIAINIPRGYRGTVYYRDPTNRINFHYKHYSVGGEDIRHNSDGSVNPWNGQVDRPVNGLGTSSTDFVVWVQKDGFNFPPTTTVDLAGGG